MTVDEKLNIESNANELEHYVDKIHLLVSTIIDEISTEDWEIIQDKIARKFVTNFTNRIMLMNEMVEDYITYAKDCIEGIQEEVWEVELLNAYEEGE